MDAALLPASQHSLAFVLNEKYMNDPKTPIKGPQLVFMCGWVAPGYLTMVLFSFSASTNCALK